MTQEQDFANPELTLANLGIQQLLQYLPQMLFMLILILGIYEDIINEHYYELVEVVHEHTIH
jgi:hypothetical protein